MPGNEKRSFKFVVGTDICNFVVDILHANAFLFDHVIALKKWSEKVAYSGFETIILPQIKIFFYYFANILQIFTTQ